MCIGIAFTTYYQVRDDIFLGKYWENDRDKLLVASYIAGFATTFLVVIGKSHGFCRNSILTFKFCRNLFPPTIKWFWRGKCTFFGNFRKNFAKIFTTEVLFAGTLTQKLFFVELFRQKVISKKNSVEIVVPHFRSKTSNRKFPEIPFSIKNSDIISLIENLLSIIGMLFRWDFLQRDP